MKKITLEIYDGLYDPQHEYECGRERGDRIVTFTTGKPAYDHEAVSDGAKEFLSFLHEHVSSGFVNALRDEIGRTNNRMG